MSYLRNRISFVILAILFVLVLLIVIPACNTFPPPPDTTPEPPKDIVVPIPTGELRTAIFETSGPTTKGALIVIAGKEIQLPADAYIAHDVVAVDCVIGGDPCPEAPLYLLARGNSTIFISISSGIIYDEKSGEGDKEPFAFLMEALQ